MQEEIGGNVNELSLFSGAGGGLLGSLLLGHTPIGYVEWDDYCQRVIAARIRDGILPDAPIFGDIKTFIREGYAASYTGLVDVVSGGFPCQPFSVAGKQKGAADERNMWPATAECIGIVRPRFVLLENVPGIRTYLPVVVRDLRRLGYEVSRPLILGADDVGAPHRRKRVWIVAHRQGLRRGETAVRGRSPQGNTGDHQHAKNDTAVNFLPSPHAPQRQDDGRDGRGMDGAAEGWEGVNAAVGAGDSDVADSLLPGSQRRGELGEPEAGRTTETGSGQDIAGRVLGWSTPWPEVAARLCRVDDELAVGMERNGTAAKGEFQ